MNQDVPPPTASFVDRMIDPTADDELHKAIIESRAAADAAEQAMIEAATIESFRDIRPAEKQRRAREAFLRKVETSSR